MPHNKQKNYDSEIENIKLLRLKIMSQVDDGTRNVHISRIISTEIDTINSHITIEMKKKNKRKKISVHDRPKEIGCFIQITKISASALFSYSV